MMHKQVIKACELMQWRKIPCLPHPLAFLQEGSHRQLCFTTFTQATSRCIFTAHSTGKFQEIVLYF